MGCPWCSTRAKYFYGMSTRFASYYSFSFNFWEWCNPSRCQTLHQIKCGLRAAESYVELDGSSPNARLVANAIENSSQSAPFFVAVPAQGGLFIHFADKINMLQFRESHLDVFFAKMSYQKHNALGKTIFHWSYLRHKSSA